MRKMNILRLLALSGGDDLLRDRRRKLLVTLKYVIEATSSLRERAKRDDVIGHLRLRHFSKNNLPSLALIVSLDTKHSAAALIEIAHHVTNVLLGNGNTELSDRLKKHGLRLRDALFIC